MDKSTIIAGTNLDPYKEYQPKVTDFDMFVPWACNEFSANIDIIITKAVQEVYVSAGSKKKFTSRRNMAVKKISSESVNNSSDVEDKTEQFQIKHDNMVRIKTVYDSEEKLVQLIFLKDGIIPRKLIKVIGLTVPYQKYLTSITINSGLCLDTLYEIANLLPISYITELYLDDTFLANPQYHLVLTKGKLKYLSLARCSISDDIVKMIADQLGYGSPAAEVLTALNLSTNRITDVGAKYLAIMLRTNRQLCYLNLAGNKITDIGGLIILDALQKFPLEAQELYKSKAKHMAYFEKKLEIVKKITMELLARERMMQKKKSMSKSKTDPFFGARPRMKAAGETGVDAMCPEKVEYLAEMSLEPFSDPFSPLNTISQDGVLHCLGNNTLCCLNLAYNELTYACVRKLREVLLTQKSKTRIPSGLFRVVLDGNLMPEACKEYEEIKGLISKIEFRSQLTSTIKLKPARSVVKN